MPVSLGPGRGGERECGLVFYGDLRTAAFKALGMN